MRHSAFTIPAVLMFALAAFLPSCVLRKPQTAKAAPPPPTPVAAPAPAPAPEPLSIPQTEVRLPPPQPLTPEAVASTLPPEEPPVSPAPPRPSPSRSRPTGTSPRPEGTPPVQGPPVPPVVEPERPPIQEVLPAAELKRFQDEAQARKREVRQIVEPIDRRRLNRQQRGMLDRVQSFLKQSDDAEHRGDMRQASELAQRALVLAHELKP